MSTKKLSSKISDSYSDDLKQESSCDDENNALNLKGNAK
jgi:hypothetical protein